ncbi:putative cytochrome P450 [Xylariaceae sp. FL0255]|nr:putative cytochrome P450 [Xylariaceae sp. FL0255]
MSHGLVCLWAIALAISYTLLLGLYRIYLHPLAGFPGPKLAAATAWYETYIDIFQRPRSTFMDEIARMHRVYGPIVRINPHELHVADSAWLDRLYVGPVNGKRDKYPPAASMTGTPRGIFGTVQHDLHRLRRGAVNPLFSKSNIDAATSMIFDHADQLLATVKLQVRRDGFAEMRANCLAFATDTVSQYATSQTRGLLRDEALAAQWLMSSQSLSEWTTITKHFRWIIPLVVMSPTVILKRLFPEVLPMVKLHQDMLNLAQQSVEGHAIKHATADNIGPTSPLPDVFSTIVSSPQLPPSEKTVDRIYQEGIVLVAAGGETMARALTTAIYAILSGNHTVQARLKEELRHAIPDPNSRPSLKQLQSLPWLSTIIKESLRLMSLPNMRFPLIAHEPLHYGDWVIPSGTPVSMTFRDVLLDEAIFYNPYDFHPERWLDKNADLKKSNRYFVAFGRGNRMCIGVSLANAELYIALASLFRSLELRLHDTIDTQATGVMHDGFVGNTVQQAASGLRVVLE